MAISETGNHANAKVDTKKMHIFFKYNPALSDQDKIGMSMAKKSSKFFLYFEKRNFNNKTVKCLKLDDGKIITQRDTIVNELHKFYSKLDCSVARNRKCIPRSP